MLISSPQSSQIPYVPSSRRWMAAFTVADTQREGAVGFRGSSIGGVGKELVAVGQILQRGISLVLRLFKHIVEERTKIFDVLLFQETTSWRLARVGKADLKLV